MINATNPKRYKGIQTKSTISVFHVILILKDSLNLATNKIAAYSIKAMNIKKRDINAKNDIPKNQTVKSSQLLKIVARSK